jgi:hypothetical protein
MCRLPFRFVANVQKGIVNIEELSLLLLFCSSDENLIPKKWINEVREPFWKSIDLFGFAQRKNQINPEQINKSARFLVLIYHKNRVEAATP